MRIGSRQIDDVHRYGVLSFTDVIVKSSNVGAIKVGFRLGPERLGRYVSRFGFGQTLVPDFRGENPGIVWSPAKLDAGAVASVSMGYQVGVTPVQMAAAVSSIANGGTLYEPRVVRATIKDGQRIEVPHKALRRTVSERTTSQMTAIMEAVVEEGTGKSARIAGYTVAGKTGTAHKVVNGAYSPSEYNASFVGFVPSRQPALAVVVVIDSPHGKGYFGGAVAAPIFKRVAEASLRHLGIAPTVNGAPPVLVSAALRRQRVKRAGRREDQLRRHARAGPRRIDAGFARSQRSGCQSRPDAHRHDRSPRRRRLRRRAIAGGGQRPGARQYVSVDARPPAARSVGSDSMTLGDLLSAVAGRAPFDVAASAAQADHAAATVASVTSDSREVVRGSVFVALRGLKTDGAAFARDAITRGAIAVVSEAAAPADAPVPWLQVSDARLALAALSAEFFGNPSSELVLVGITGTNGKTTTSYVLASIFEAAGIRCGRIGTVGYQVGDREVEATRTTPEAPALHRLLREMVAKGSGACVMEASSHALALRRVDYLHFSAAIFTNLTRDHLDFHRDMEEYFLAKRRLFELLPPGGVGVVNLDDRRGAALAAVAPRPVTYAIDAPSDVRPGPLSLSLDGLAFEVRTPRGSLALRSSLVGRPNAYNILAAVGAAVALDLPFNAIQKGVANLTRVPGRFEVVSDPGDDVRVVVDYAHTDDALKNLLETARPLSAGRLITVFGCGGDRDRPKRSLMGAVAARLSDLVVVTSDNPRSESPEQIIEEIKRGIVMPADRTSTKSQGGAKATPYLAITDRKSAIERAVQEARSGDLVLVAGKGHEKYQEIGDRVLPFDDVEVAKSALARRRARSRVP